MANHSQLDEFKMNLQLFAEGDPEPTPAPEPMPEPSPEPGTPTPDPEPTPDPIPQAIKVKFNHQELELPYEEAVQHIQKGMNYDKAVERARQEAAQQARDSWIAEQNYEWKGKPITTEAQYKRALQEQELENKIRAQYANVPDEILNELLEGKRFREESLAEKKAREEAEKKAQDEKDFATRRDSMYNEFMTEFPEYDTEEKWKSIPKEVWADADKWLKSGGREGRRLADALAKHNLKQMQAQNQAAQANQANADSSTGSARGQAKSGTFFTREQVANMSREEIKQNYNAIKESEGRWK